MLDNLSWLIKCGPDLNPIMVVSRLHFGAWGARAGAREGRFRAVEPRAWFAPSAPGMTRAAQGLAMFGARALLI